MMSKAQALALELVRAGRVEYGARYPEMARRAAARGRSTMNDWIVDGYPCDGRQGITFTTLEVRGDIVVRRDLVPMHTVPETVKTYRSIAGGSSTQTVPAHEAPVDPGWRAPVEEVVK